MSNTNPNFMSFGPDYITGFEPHEWNAQGFTTEYTDGTWYIFAHDVFWWAQNAKTDEVLGPFDDPEDAAESAQEQ